MGVGKQSGLPLYVQVKETLASRIAAGIYPVGGRLPSEAELARELGVGTATVKQAIGALAAAGVVTRRPSQGTYVASRPAEPGAVPLRSFTESMRERGLRVHSRVLARTVEPASASVAWQLDCTAGDPVLHLRRLRLAQDRPVALEDLFFPLDVVPGLQPDQLPAEAVEGSFSQLLEERYGLALIGAVESVWVQGATAAEAQLLQIAPGAPVLVAERITEISGHQRGFLTHTVYRADAYQLRFRLTRYPEAAAVEPMSLPQVGALGQRTGGSIRG